MAAFWLRLFFSLTATAPWLVQACKPLFVRLAYLFSGKIRKATACNARRIFDAPLTPAEQRRFGLDVTGNFYEFVFDVGRSLRATPQELAKRIESVEGHEHYVAARAMKKGAILLTAHMGSFELAAAALMERERRIHVVFRRDRFAAFEQLRQRLHQQLGVVETPLEESWTVWLRLRDALLADEVIAMQGDRVMPGQRGIELPFLHGTLALPSGPAKLASASGAPIVPVFSIRTSTGVRIFVEEPFVVPNPLDDAALDGAMHRIATVLEKYVRDYPQQWLVLEPAFSEDAIGETSARA